MRSSDEQAYLSLSAASKRIGVHTTTLRRWADAGIIPVYTTPGGHRRFARSDIDALVARKPLSAHALTQAWAARALSQTRSELAHAEQQRSWLMVLSDEERGSWRTIGQQLMDVVRRYIGTPQQDDALLEEARILGVVYAQAALRTGMPLTATLEAALFFRDSLAETAMDMPEETSMRQEERAQLLRRLSQVANVVQLAVVQVYEEQGKRSPL